MSKDEWSSLSPSKDAQSNQQELVSKIAQLVDVDQLSKYDHTLMELRALQRVQTSAYWVAVIQDAIGLIRQLKIELES